MPTQLARLEELEGVFVGQFGGYAAAFKTAYESLKAGYQTPGGMKPQDESQRKAVLRDAFYALRANCRFFEAIEEDIFENNEDEIPPADIIHWGWPPV